MPCILHIYRLQYLSKVKVSLFHKDAMKFRKILPLVRLRKRCLHKQSTNLFILKPPLNPSMQVIRSFMSNVQLIVCNEQVDRTFRPVNHLLTVHAKDWRAEEYFLFWFLETAALSALHTNRQRQVGQFVWKRSEESNGPVDGEKHSEKL